MSIFEFDLQQTYSNLVHLAIAFLLPVMTAWEREKHARSAGLRTFPLVSLAACSFTLLAANTFTDPNAQAKLIEGIITGIGFIGGGAILKNKSTVNGTSTAAAIWATGGVGIAVGLGHIEIAIALSAMTFVALRLGSEVKNKVSE